MILISLFIIFGKWLEVQTKQEERGLGERSDQGSYTSLDFTQEIQVITSSSSWMLLRPFIEGGGVEFNGHEFSKDEGFFPSSEPVRLFSKFC